MSNDQPLRILIADDHPSYRRELREILSEQPDLLVVDEAENGIQAVSKALALRPGGLDVILMDIDMPEMDGLTATEELTGRDPHLAIVMLTVSTLDRDLFEAIRRGAVGYLSKGLSSQRLVKALQDFHHDHALPMSRQMATKVLKYFQGRGSAAASHRAAELSLTAREQEVLELISQGLRDRDIAERLVIGESTVKKHVQNILRKLHARNRAEAVARMRGR